MENCDLNLGQVEELKKAEGNILKRILYLPKSSKSTELHSALRIDLTKEAITKQKLQFLARLRKNEYTDSLLTEISKNSYKGNFLCELKSKTELANNTSLDSLTIIAKEKIRAIESAVETRANTSAVKLIQKVFEINCSKARTNRLRNLLNSYEPVTLN
jgi:hypothetical protein